MSHAIPKDNLQQIAQAAVQLPKDLQPAGGFHLVGASSRGKTTALLVAASGWERLLHDQAQRQAQFTRGAA